MPKNLGRSVGDPCEECGKPLVEGKKGPYCKACYIAWAEKKKSSWSNPQPSPQGSTQGNFGAHSPISESVRQAQVNKENSMRIFSSGRDAVLIVCAEMAQDKIAIWSDEEVKDKILKWNEFFYEKIYVDTPFKG